jgi:hypothetical protein
LAPVLVVVTQSFLAGRPRWALTVLTFLLAAVTVRVLQRFLIRLGNTIRLGPTQLEISDLPLYPGQRYELCLVQAGRMSLSTMEVLLVCEEYAMYREGTNVRVEQRRVSEQTLFISPPCEVRPNAPLVHRGEFLMPEAAMHSFRAPNNAIHWKLLVQGRLTTGLRFERVFPTVVYPSGVVEERV